VQRLAFRCGLLHPQEDRLQSGSLATEIASATAAVFPGQVWPMRPKAAAPRALSRSPSPKRIRTSCWGAKPLSCQNIQIGRRR
jgi:hypothetical protein